MRDLLLWARSKLRSAVINDITKDFCDGTVLMELVVVLAANEAAVSDALLHFAHLPTTMAHSLENISCVLALLRLEGIQCSVKPLDIFRGKKEAIMGVLGALRLKYDPDSQAKQDIITKQDIVTDWARSVCEHTESLRQSGPAAGSSDPGSDHDTGFIEPSSNGSGGNAGSADLLHDLRSQDESYQNIDVIEVEEKLVRADSKITISHNCNRRACVYVSISMKHQVTDLPARDSFVKQATKNYRLLDCEVPDKDLHKLGLGYLNLLITCSYTRSLRTKSVGIFSPYLLGLQTINIAENRQLFAHVLRGRIRIAAFQQSDHVKFTLQNVSGGKLHVVVPEGTVWQQTDINGDSHVVMKEMVIRTLDPEETEEVKGPCLLLNKQGGGSRGQPLALTPFIFRGPISEQDRVFNYSDPDEEGLFRFCADCKGVIHRGLYGVKYFNNRPIHLECGPPCSKCGLNCLNLILKEDNKPYCSLECYYLSQNPARHCTRCRVVLAPSDRGSEHRRHCPKPCRLCTMSCLDFERFPGPLCSKLCQDWDTLKNRICQGCGQPIIHKASLMEVDKMYFHSVHCFRSRATAPPLIIQRAMVRGKHYEVQELRRLIKTEFEKRSHRRREALRLKAEEGERKHNLQHVMDCITKIEGINRGGSSSSDRKYGTLQTHRKVNHPSVRTRSLSSCGADHRSDGYLGESRKRTDTRELRRCSSETGSFLDLLFSSDEDTEPRPPGRCIKFTRSSSERDSQRSRKTLDIEKRKLNRGFPTGVRQPRQHKARSRSESSRVRSTESESSDIVLIAAPSRPSKRFLSLKRSASKGSTGSTTSSSLSPIEFERPNLFEQLRCEQQISIENRSTRDGDVRRASHKENRDPGSNYKPRTGTLARALSDDPAKHYTSRSWSATKRSTKPSPTFEMLFHEDANRTSQRSPTDPLSNAKTKPMIIGSSSTLPTPNLVSNLVPNKTMTDAQRRYERRFSRSRSKSRSEDEQPPPPVVRYPVLKDQKGYSLELIETEEKKEKREKTWTSPRLVASPLEQALGANET